MYPTWTAAMAGFVHPEGESDLPPEGLDLLRPPDRPEEPMFHPFYWVEPEIYEAEVFRFEEEERWEPFRKNRKFLGFSLF